MATSLLDPISVRDWDDAKARHLLSRAGFGIPLRRVAHLSSLRPREAVSYFVDYERFADPFPEPDWLESPVAVRQLEREARMTVRMEADVETETEEERRQLTQQRTRMLNRQRRREMGADMQRLKSWWYERIIEGPRPLEEKMTLFWHGHFATSANKVRSPYANYHLNRIFRVMATGNFKLLTYEVCCSPAMMVYLDNARSRKAHPNENWAREFMELFTLGQGHYTEDDIKNAARAFTGWTTNGEDFVYEPRNHDQGAKEFMGRKGPLNGNDVFDILFARRRAAEFIVEKLWTFFAYAEPEPEIVEGLATVLYDQGYALKPMLRAMFLSRAFYSPRATGSHIKSPVELIATMASQLDIEFSPLVRNYTLHSARRMGQDMFFPPNVKGWPGGRTWISAGTLMTRYNLSNFFIHGVVSDPGPGFREVARAELGEIVDKIEKIRRRERRRRKRDGILDEEMNPMAEVAGGEKGGPRGIRLPTQIFDARGFFAQFDGLAAEGVADALVSYFLSVPVSRQQKNQIARALAGPRSLSEKFDSREWDEERMRGTVHLILSSSEYQLS